MPPVEDDILKFTPRYEGHIVAAVAQQGGDVLFEDILEVKGGKAISRKEMLDKYLFLLGSASKIIAGLVLYILLDRPENENVSLDDPVSRHGLHFKGAEEIKIRSLLTHQSGLPNGNDLLLGPAGRPLQDRDAARSMIEGFAGAEFQQRKSGTEINEFHYSNIGYILLARVIEAIAGGRKYHDIVEEEILVPFKMKNTYASRSKYESRDKSAAILAPPHIEVDEGDFEEISPVLYFDDTALLPALGICSCLQDMKTFFSQLLRAHHYSNSEHAEPLPIPAAHGFLRFNQGVAGLDTRYGAGVRLQSASPREAGHQSQHMQPLRMLKNELPLEAIYHGGAVRGFESSFELYPEENCFFVSFSNATSLGDVADDIRRVLISHFLPRIKVDDILRDSQKKRKDRLQAVGLRINNYREYSKQPSPAEDITNLRGEYIAENGGPRITIAEKEGQNIAIMDATGTSQSGDNDLREFVVRFDEDVLTICPEAPRDLILYLGNDFLRRKSMEMKIQREGGRVTGLIRHLVEDEESEEDEEDSSIPVLYRKI